MTVFRFKHYSVSSTNSLHYDLCTVQILYIGTDRSQQTVQTKIRLLLKKQSDQGLRCLPFYQHLFGCLNAMLHQTFLFLGQLWQLFEVSQILEFLRYAKCSVMKSASHTLYTYCCFLKETNKKTGSTSCSVVSFDRKRLNKLHLKMSFYSAHTLFLDIFPVEVDTWYSRCTAAIKSLLHKMIFFCQKRISRHQ